MFRTNASPGRLFRGSSGRNSGHRFMCSVSPSLSRNPKPQPEETKLPLPGIGRAFPGAPGNDLSQALSSRLSSSPCEWPRRGSCSTPTRPHSEEWGTGSSTPFLFSLLGSKAVLSSARRGLQFSKERRCPLMLRCPRPRHRADVLVPTLGLSFVLVWFF